MISSLADIHELSSPTARVVLSRAVHLVLLVDLELCPMCQPACQSGYGIKDGEHVSWEAHGAVD
jgi:hypothetical protein